MSPTFTVVGSSFFPGPTATTVPSCGFSLAVSGMMIPEAVLVSAAVGSTNTLSANGLKFTDIFIFVLIISGLFLSKYMPKTKNVIFGRINRKESEKLAEKKSLRPQGHLLF